MAALPSPLPELDAARARIVAAALEAVERGDFDADPVLLVFYGRVGTPADRIELCERIRLVERVMRSCGRL